MTTSVYWPTAAVLVAFTVSRLDPFVGLGAERGRHAAGRGRRRTG